MLLTLRSCALLLAAAFAGSAWAAPQVGEPARPRADRAEPVPAARKKLPQRQVGKASIYANKFAGRKMANGRPMDPRDDNAASKTLPLGTKALVRNLDTGRSAVVTIEDRGPYVPGRIVDLSPATAEQIGLTRKEGLAPVEVVPLHIPGKDRQLAEK